MRWTLLKHTQLTPGGAFFARNAKRAKRNAERWGALTWSALGWTELIDCVFNMKNYSTNIYIYLSISIYLHIFIYYIYYYIYIMIYIYTYIINIYVCACVCVCTKIIHLIWCHGLGLNLSQRSFWQRCRQRCRHRAPHLVMTWHSQHAMERSTMLFLNGVNHLFRLGP